jgi:Enoyl-CoA hydratase/carnithine racemase
MNSEPEILFERRGSAGVVTLNRPQALNAVTLIMVRALREQLDAWRDDPAVSRVVITGAGAARSQPAGICAKSTISA